jgi:tryptophan synthase alpha chain
MSIITPNKRITEKFTRLAEKNEMAFIPFLVIGDPDPFTFIEIVKAIEPYSDIIELGIPFSDPIADGSVIQAADIRAFASGTTFETSFALIQEIRNFSQKPIVLLTYANVLGVDEERTATLQRFADIGVDGIVAADIPIEESTDLIVEMNSFSLDLILLAAPTTHDSRLTNILENAQGFLYLVAIKGVTGAREYILTETSETIERIIMANTLPEKIPICVGFGISKPEHVHQINDLGADGVIVGSALITIIEQNLADIPQMIIGVTDFVSQMKDATHKESL